MVTAGILSSLGDCLAQTMSRMEDAAYKYNPARTFHFLLKGLGGGVMWSSWYAISDDLSLACAGVFDQDGTVARTTSAILLEQFLFCPVIYSLWDIPLPALLSGSPLRSMPAQVQSKLPDLLVANAKLWTPVNIVTYNLPVEYRVLFISFVDVIWQAVISTIANREETTSAAPVLPPVLAAEPAATPRVAAMAAETRTP